MNRVLREKIGDRVWAVVVDNLVIEEYKYLNGQVYDTVRRFTGERRYLTKNGLAVEFAGPEDLYATRGEADSVAMLLVMAHPDYIGHIEVVNVRG